MFVADLNLRALLLTLWRRRYVILASVLGALVLGWGALSLQTPRYTATAEVMLDNRRSNLTEFRPALSDIPMHMLSVYSEVEVVQSRSVAQRVVDALDLMNDPEFNPSLRPPAEGVLVWLRGLIAAKKVEVPETEEERQDRLRRIVVDGLRGHITVVPIQKSLVFSIGVTDPDPAKAARIANEVANQYVVEQLEAKFSALRTATSWLNMRLGELRQAVDASERAVADYREANGLTEVKGQRVSQQKLTELSSQLIIVQGQVAQAEAQVNRADALIKAGRGVDAIAEIAASPMILSLKEQEVTLSRQISDMATRYGPRHPEMIKVQAERRQIQGKIAIEVDKVVAGMRHSLGVLTQREATLKAEVSAAEGEVEGQNQSNVRLNDLEREAVANRDLYETMLARFKETGSQDEVQRPDARVISAATPPMGPSSPKRGLTLFGSTLIGFIGGVVLVLLIERFGNTYRTREQMETATGMTSLGMVPQIGRSRDRAKVARYLVDNPASSYAEVFRTTWLSLRYAMVDGGCRVIVVTSSIPGEGKTQSALALARTAANLGMRAVLIDGDLRKSSVSDAAEVPKETVFSEVLMGEASVESALVRDPLSNLQILPGRPIEKHHVDLLASFDRAKQVVDVLRETHDVIIIDSPPALLVADVQVLARLADQVVFCVQWDKTPRETVSAALKVLSDAMLTKKTTLLMTRVNIRRHSQYGYRDSGYYYGRYKQYGKS
jgi:capsular exopolysaccharide synthesis family protein